MRINIGPRSLKGRDHVGDVGVGGKIGLKMIKKNHVEFGTAGNRRLHR